MAHTLPKQDFAVIGLGRFGTSLALKLAELGHSVLGIDRRLDLVQLLADGLTQTVALDATDEDALRSVGIDEFKTAVVAIGDDFESSILITTLLKEIGVPTVICKAPNERQKTILLRVGADQVVLPEHEAGVRLARHLATPLLIDQLELGSGLMIGEVRCPAALAGHSLRELALPDRLDLQVLLIKGQRLQARPRPDDVLAETDVLLVLGTEESIARLPTWQP